MSHFFAHLLLLDFLKLVFESHEYVFLNYFSFLGFWYCFRGALLHFWRKAVRRSVWISLSPLFEFIEPQFTILNCLNHFSMTILYIFKALRGLLFVQDTGSYRTNLRNFLGLFGLVLLDFPQNPLIFAFKTRINNG